MNQVDIAATLPIRGDQALQHVDAAKIDLINLMHPNQHRTLLGKSGSQLHDLLFDMTDRTEIEIPLDFDDVQLRTDG